jgi:hypothetical protein
MVDVGLTIRSRHPHPYFAAMFGRSLPQQLATSVECAGLDAL